jgi:Protein of unknown function (DUF3179)
MVRRKARPSTVGHHAGTRLVPVPAPLVNGKTFKETHPEGRVLSRDTGYDRPYGRNPYQRYDERDGPIAQFFRGRQDPRLPAMERVVSVDVAGEAVAYAFSLLAERRVVNDRAGETRLVIFWAPGTASALSADRVAGGREVGATTVFDRRTAAGVLEFTPAGDGRFRDRQTGSTWDQLGRATSGRLAGTQLRPVAHGNPFWFAWVAFRPDTRLVR